MALHEMEKEVVRVDEGIDAGVTDGEDVEDATQSLRHPGIQGWLVTDLPQEQQCIRRPACDAR